MNHKVQVHPQWNTGATEMKSIDTDTKELKMILFTDWLCVEKSLVVGSFTTLVVKCATIANNEWENNKYLLLMGTVFDHCQTC